MQKKAKQYSAEEKTKVVLEVIKGELSMAQISGKYGIHTTQITNWKKQGIGLLIQGFKSGKNTGDPNSQQQELIKNLYEQIGQLTVERDWLKKKSELFGFKG
jgi:transposase